MKISSKNALLRGSAALQAFALLGAGVVAVGMHSAPASAQGLTSGSLDTTIVDQDGKPVPNATVTVTSGQGYNRQVTTDANGRASISVLPLGAYDVSVTKDGFESIQSSPIQVSLGGSGFSFRLYPTGTESTIVVTGARAIQVDVSRAATGSVFNVQETFARIPVQRSITGIQLLAPQSGYGDTAFDNNTSPSNVSIGGGSVAENIFYINGMNVTNFRTGVGGGTVPFEFYDQVQIKTGGYQAEYGRATGGAVIATTRSGSNEMKGGMSIYWEPSFLRDNAPNTYAALNQDDERQNYEGNIWASGPIIKDRLFFFGFFNPRFRSRFDRTTAVTSLNPDGSTTTAQSQIYSKNSEPFFGGKLDFIPVDGHHLELTYFKNNETERGTFTSFVTNTPAGGTPGAPAASATPFVSRYGGQNIIGKYTGELTDWLTVSALYGVTDYKRSSSGARPYIVDQRSGTAVQVSGHPDGTVETAKDKRKLFRIDADVRFSALGEHNVRAGFDQERLYAEANEFYSGGAYYLLYPTPGAAGALGGLIPAGQPYVRERFRFANGSFKSKNTAFYIQDSWDITDRLNLGLGVRSETFQNFAGNGKSFTKLSDNIAPRLSATYDAFGDGRTIFNAFFGRYYLPVAANTNIRLGGNETFTQEYFYLNGIDPNTGLPILGQSVRFDVLSSSNADEADARVLTSQNLKPQYQDEIIVGVKQRVGDRWTFGVNYIRKRLKSVLEDADLSWNIAAFCDTQNVDGCRPGETPAAIGGGGDYVLINPGRDIVTYVDLVGDGNLTEITIPAALSGYPKAKRKYDAVEFTFDRAWDGRFSLAGSYVWAKSRGNYEGGVKSDNGQDDTGLTTDFDEPGWMDGANGYLPNDRRHTFKVYGSYAVSDNFTVGVFGFLQSPRRYGCIGVYDPAVGGAGRAITSLAGSWYCRTQVAPATTNAQGVSQGGVLEGQFPTSLIGRGNAFKSDWRKQIDLNLVYKLPVMGGLTLRADVFNVFNFKSKVDFREVGETDGGTADPNYGKVSAYQTPRYVRLGASLEF
ncbi:TonB-dependent receptor-like protein [Sphingobium chlorophenolicum]|uniref:TonB-dependent receptor-like protein n=1 Tax=Sphingobium chlorophenolicum TaxID=46429 RepID=A0A081RHF7_SPHCR|nr:TonB-dependent receptor [Sphingobium chlorophenolicum]KEQ54630.1 TonB-dependent receptor-like protein [Sphingobium chlorophenolicum]